MSQTYQCPCSKCLGSKSVVKRTVEEHYERDQGFLDALLPDTISAKFVRSCVDKTIKLLAGLNKDPGMPDLASDSVISRSEGSEGAFLSIILNYFY